MTTPLRIATWNLDHASNSSRPVPLQVATIVTWKPDILILTETCKEVADCLEQHLYKSFLSRPNQYRKFCSAIHLGPRCHYRESLPTFNDICATCIRATTDIGEMIIYGTIITYRDDKGADRNAPAPAWSEHYKAIEKHGNDWSRLPRSVPLVVAGDFNQTRDNSKNTYGTKEGRALLGNALDRNNLKCLTTENFGANKKLKIDPAKGWPRNNVDHICMTSNAFRVVEVGAWDHFAGEPGAVQYLSDHNGVYVDLAGGGR